MWKKDFIDAGEEKWKNGSEEKIKFKSLRNKTCTSHHISSPPKKVKSSARNIHQYRRCFFSRLDLCSVLFFFLYVSPFGLRSSSLWTLSDEGSIVGFLLLLAVIWTSALCRLLFFDFLFSSSESSLELVSLDAFPLWWLCPLFFVGGEGGGLSLSLSFSDDDEVWTGECVFV